MGYIIFQAGQRVYVLGSAICGKQWNAQSEPGTIGDFYEGANVSEYYVKLDRDADRTLFCTSDELRPMPCATQ